MRLIKVAAAALNQTPLDWDNNKANILAAVDAARQAGASIICLPELCISGYGCEDAFFSSGVQQMACRVLLEIAPQTRGLIVAVGLPLMRGNGLFNAACLLADGQILGFACKQNLASEGIHYEPRWFKPWPPGLKTDVRIGEADYPMGDLLFDCGGIRLGFEICEDAWVADRPGAELARSGVDVVLNPSASHFAFDKQDVRRRYVLEGSRAFSVSYIYANLLGNEAGRAIYDGGTIIASGGRMLAEGARFSYAQMNLCTAVLDVDATRISRAQRTDFPAQPIPAEPATVQHAFTPVEAHPEANPGPLVGWEAGAALKHEEFARAVPLALYDYLRKSRSGGFVVSISGGADSAAVTTLVGLTVRLGTAELGCEGFTAKLSHIEGIGRLDSAEAIISRLLGCVYQSTCNSSATTRNAASRLAEAVGARFFQFDVDPVVQQYVDMVAAAIGRDLTWQQDDVALQNIQARARAPGVWLLANLSGSLLLATSNRSEAAVGYATMDGDTCGGLSPIAGIDKAFLRHWLRWMQTEGPAGVGPLPELDLVNAQQPTAELRPQQAGQTDEDDLMPYDVLDAIERAAIRDKHVPLEVFHLVESQFPQFDRRQLGEWVERFFRLWTRNQWKRERYAPSFHLDDENLDPKTWCRFPILSGGFQRELAALQNELKDDSGN